MYVVMWLPKVVMFVLGVGVFCMEFYGIFWVMKLEQHGLMIQVIGIVMTLAGLLILMRKGYLSMIEKYHLTKLKSVLEHLQVAYDFLIDSVGLVLTVINMILLVKIGETLSYEYNSERRYNYLRHIFDLVRQSIIFYI